MGPIHDQQGLEQGGVNSSDFYKIFGKEQLTTSQDSKLGIPLRNVSVSSIGQADDTVLISNDLRSLQFLLLLTKNFCDKYQVKICGEKTKLQVYNTKNMNIPVEYSKKTVPLFIDDKHIDFNTTAEHLGMLRSIQGNNVTIMTRITAHRQALTGVLHSGMARGHRGSPVTSLHIEKMFASPVLLSGLAPLLLTRKEENLIDQHHKSTLQGLLRLYPRTPRSVVCFLAGSLPGCALLHLRMLSIFGMICRLPENILHRYALDYFTSASLTSTSWFSQIRKLCLFYDLPNPIVLLQEPHTKLAFKSLVKKRVISYWEQTLRHEATLLPSLTYFKPGFMSLVSAHPLWTTAG